MATYMLPARVIGMRSVAYTRIVSTCIQMYAFVYVYK